MVASLLHPLNIFIIGLGGGFLIPLLSRLGTRWTSAAFVVALAAIAVISGLSLLRLANGAAAVEILTGGATPPYAINLRLGFPESIFTFGVSVIALLGAPYFVRTRYPVLLLYLILITGVCGMVMTRDLFNLFVFLEIVSIATYGLLGLQNSAAALSASFKYLMATVIASTFFLLGTLLLYSATGMLNIDDLIASKDTARGAFGFAALMFLPACLLVELKPFPANGWGLDVYETARGSVAALVAVVVSAGVFFAFVKLLPLFEDQLQVIAILAAATFLFSNLIGLAQDKAQRLLGYSSVGQMGLVTLALVLLYRRGEANAVPLIVIALFINHLLAKAALFWLSGWVNAERLRGWSVLTLRPAAVFAFGALLAAIAGFPPFPAFWAKWHLVMSLTAGERYIWIAVILLGSLLEAAYLFRWFGKSLQQSAETRPTQRSGQGLLPIFGAVCLLAISGYVASIMTDQHSIRPFVPLAAGFAIFLLDGLASRTKAALVTAVTTVVGFALVKDLSGISFLFSVLLLAGGSVLSIACLYHRQPRRGFYPLLVVMLLSLSALPGAATGLEFFFIWELITLSSYFLLARHPAAAGHALRYLLFSLVSAFFLLAGFAIAQAATGSPSLAALRTLGANGNAAFVLLTVGCLIKAAAIGVHVWLPGAYAEADDDISAILSAVVSKAPMFGLLVCTYVAARSDATIELAYAVGLIGMLTTLACAMMAVRQDDIKYLLAWSSMSQLGYVVTAVALLSHLGWVTALYLVANHLMVKGMLFLAAAGIILRVGSRKLGDFGGLARRMPLISIAAAFAIVAMSGLPPLTGFGGKWLLLNAMLEKHWYAPLAIGALATLVGLLYMAKLLLAIFRSASDESTMTIAEAPIALLVPQYMLAFGIVVVSFFPKLLIEPVSSAIDPYFSSTLVWNGMSLDMIYAFWNPVPTMIYALAVAAVLFAVLRLLRGLVTGETILYAFHEPLFAKLTPSLAQMFWDATAAVTRWLAGKARLIYTGNGQTCILYILYYFLALYAAGLGFIDR